jgi:hypothetical protein
VAARNGGLPKRYTQRSRSIFVESLTTMFSIYHDTAVRLVLLLLCTLTSSVFAQLTISVTTDKPTYVYGETITLSATVTNTADSAITISQAWQGPVSLVSFDNVALHWIVVPTDLPVDYAPHSARSSVFKLDGSRLGLPNRLGPHTLACLFRWQLGDRGFLIRDSVIINQPIYLGGQLLVQFLLSTSSEQIQALRDSVHATVLSSNTYPPIVSERWNTSGFVLDSLVVRYSGDSRLTAIAPDRSIQAPTSIVTGIDRSHSAVPGTRLLQNFPNPFNPNCAIQFELPFAQDVTIVVFDMLGRLVFRESRYVSTAGLHQIRFDGSRLPSGVYVYKLQTPAVSLSRTMLLIK